MLKEETKFQLPEYGINPDALLKELEERRQGDLKWKEGRVWSLVYYIDDEHLDLLYKAYQLYFSENMLNPYAFKSLKELENEVMGMAINLMNGNKETVGVLTTGGTESIFQAVYTYREWARKNKPGIKQPEIVIPNTLHPAFEKAAYIQNIKVVKIPVGKDLRAQPDLMEKAINKNTIFMAASAPSYANGVLDPIQELAAIAKSKALPFHVDACVGGYMLPWVERLGHKIPEWDFRVDGVTSISADLHKLGYAAKGCSTLMYSSMKYMRHQFFIATEFPGGIYASASLLGSRSGGPVAAAWVALKSLGESGYVAIAEKVMQATEKLKTAISAIPEMEILSDPVMNIISFATINNKPDIFVIADFLEEKGWLVDRQQFPNSIHLTIMHHHIPAIPQYVEDLKSAIAYAKANPSATSKGNAALYGLMARIPFRGMVKSNVRKLFEEMYANPESNYKPVAEDEAPAAPSPGDSGPAWAGLLNRVLAFFKK